MKKIIAGVLMVSLAGCSWVKAKPGADKVSLVKTEHVANCKKIGKTSTQSRDNVAFINRRDEKVSQELVALAKNEAVEMGGDTIVAEGKPIDGRQIFLVYKCE